MPTCCPKCAIEVLPALKECPACGVIFARIHSVGSLSEDPQVEGAAGKGRKLTEAEIVEEAVDAGIELGLETCPAKIRGKVDVEAARRLTRERLFSGMFRQNVAAYEESLRGLEALESGASSPTLATLKDVEHLISTFALTRNEAITTAHEADALLNYGPKNTEARLESVRRAMERRIKEILEAQTEASGQTIGREAISTAERALREVALRQGLLDSGR